MKGREMRQGLHASTHGGRRSSVEIGELDVAGVAVLLARPCTDGPHPTVVVYNAAGQRHSAPSVRRVVTALARIGFLTAAPALDGLHRAEVTPATLVSAIEAAEAVANRADVRDGRIALAGASTGAGLALLAAADPRLVDRVSAVAAIAPFADLRKIVRLATTGVYEDGRGRLRRYTTAPLLRRAVARSITAMTPGDSPAVEHLLANRNPLLFDELYAQLPARVGEAIASLSPVTRIGCVRARVELACAPDDPYFPLAEAAALAAAAPDARLLATRSLSHVGPRLRGGGLRGAMELGAFAGRFLRATSRGHRRPRCVATSPRQAVVAITEVHP